MAEAEVSKFGILDMQVCVPGEWSDDDIVKFAEEKYPCGIKNGWFIRKDEKSLGGAPERNPCERDNGNVHVMLDA